MHLPHTLVILTVAALPLYLAAAAGAQETPGRTTLSIAYGYFRQTTPAESDQQTSSTTFTDLKLTRDMHKGLLLGGVAGTAFGTVDSRYAGLVGGYRYRGFSAEVLWLPTAVRTEPTASFREGRGLGADLGYSVRITRRLSFGGQMSYRWFDFDALEVQGSRRTIKTAFRQRTPQLTLGYSF
mgnify:CR=1 FL=1